MRAIVIAGLIVGALLIGCSDDEPSNPTATEVGLDSLIDVQIVTLFVPLEIEGAERVVIQLYDVNGEYLAMLLSRDLEGQHAIYQTADAIMLTDGESDEVLLRHDDYDSGVYFIKLWVGIRQSTRSLVIPPHQG